MIHAIYVPKGKRPFTIRMELYYLVRILSIMKISNFLHNFPVSGETSITQKSSRQLIQREDVEATLRKDVGSAAVLTNFTIKDFTSSGDHIASAITSIIVNYQIGGKTEEISYVVKLNPLRDSMFDKFTKTLFGKEAEFLTQILPELNKQLKNVGESPLHVPRLIHGVLADHKQAYYMEDLRRKHFKMGDRKAGLDRSLTECVLTELARLHASSVLLMNSPENQGVDIKVKFPLLEEFFDAIKDENSSVNIDNFFPGTEF